eukprot:13125908-Alexandrium_andersonii.AAC.1
MAAARGATLAGCCCGDWPVRRPLLCTLVVSLLSRACAAMMACVGSLRGRWQERLDAGSCEGCAAR